MNLYLLRPAESTQALVVVAEDEEKAKRFSRPYGGIWPNVMPIGLAASGLHAGVLVEGRLHVEARV